MDLGKFRNWLISYNKQRLSSKTVAVRFKNEGLYLETPRFDFTNTPGTQVQNAAGLINIANSFKVNQDNNTNYGAVAANAAANRIANDSTWMQQAGGIISAKHTAETNEKIHKWKLQAMKKDAQEKANKQVGGSIGSLIGGGLGLAIGGPMGAAVGSKLGGGIGSMFG